MPMNRFQINSERKGRSFPLGATLVAGGANFSLFAKHSTGAELLLFDHVDAPQPSRGHRARSEDQPHLSTFVSDSKAPVRVIHHLDLLARQAARERRRVQ